MTTRSLTRKQFFRSPTRQPKREHLIHPRLEDYGPASTPSRGATGFAGRAAARSTEKIEPLLSDSATVGTPPADTAALPPSDNAARGCAPGLWHCFSAGIALSR
jgi:hypothetical protein